ncbi:anthranilate synthase component I [Bowdeniella nasicola]|uniref:Anthranilate synthase component 1 n=1 Tax=Bowdeniella nasicola TaxID=208480 RepID=A0A1Q5Q4V5_9ACTO|nr:chorismate-binding protein [Bowdeniella nasicola]OKL54854.1 anthranilate synthase component I [Bowdeniella nasicola]
MTWGETTPDLAGFRRLAQGSRAVPITRRLLAEDLTPGAAYRTFVNAPGSFILESAEHGEWGRWSFVGANCRTFLISEPDGEAYWHGQVPAGFTVSGPALDLAREAAELLRHGPVGEDCPPFTGGLVGALGWEIVRSLEHLPPRVAPDVPVPDVAMALATDILAFDHRSGDVWLIASAINYDGSDERVDDAYRDALARLDQMEAALEDIPTRGIARREAPAECAEPTFNMAPEEFMAIVARAKDAIRDGEVFQIVLSQRAELACSAEALDVYRVLRATNPSPYMFLLHLPTGEGESFHIVGSSPETLVEVRERAVRTFPIAGSRPRGATPTADARIADELLADPKERAEHVMLVDLARNDLSRVCTPGSVTVPDYMAIKRYSHIMHITSTVTGTLADECEALDALAAAFPAGTLSGAPKVRAMELIDELEPTRRGIYGGVVGYLDWQGNLDMAIAIRTAVIARGRAYVQAGAGIVADSDPQSELHESRTKAAAALAAVARANQLRGEAQ